MSQRATLYIDQGADFLVNLDVFDDSGTPLDLTGYTGSSAIRKVYSTFAIANFDIEIDDENKIVLLLGAEITQDLSPGKYQYDVLLTSPENVRTKIVEGLLFVIPTMTRLET